VHPAEWLGHEALLRVRVDGAPNDWIVRLDAEDVAPEPGATVRLRADPGDVHRFDASTGLRR
jgi:hypothetical protein